MSVDDSSFVAGMFAKAALQIFMHKTTEIFLNALPVILMIAFIPFVSNDFLLAIIDIVIIIIALSIDYEKKDGLVFLFGFAIMTLSETIFVLTGVETFVRHTLFIMPLWLPFLWAYAFVGIKRSVLILER